MSDGPIMSDGLHNRRIYVFENQDGVRGLEWWIGTGKGMLGEGWGVHPGTQDLGHANLVVQLKHEYPESFRLVGLRCHVPCTRLARPERTNLRANVNPV